MAYPPRRDDRPPGTFSQTENASHSASRSQSAKRTSSPATHPGRGQFSRPDKFPALHFHAAERLPLIASPARLEKSARETHVPQVRNRLQPHQSFESSPLVFHRHKNL